MNTFSENFLIKAEDIKLFAQAVGDPNPIHQDDAVARKMGLEGAIAHGMFMHSYLMRRLDEWMLREKKEYGRKWELCSSRCRFHEPALVGKLFTSTLELSEKNSSEAEGLVKMNMTFSDEKGTKLTHILAQLKAV